MLTFVATPEIGIKQNYLKDWISDEILLMAIGTKAL